LDALSGGRVSITLICAQYMIIAVTIAIRYCAVRRQFGPTEDSELPVIEYEMQVCITSKFLLKKIAAIENMYVVAMANYSSFSRNIRCKNIFNDIIRKTIQFYDKPPSG
jgi:hypothetical protein